MVNFYQKLGIKPHASSAHIQSETFAKPPKTPQIPPHPTMTSFFYQTAQSLINQYPDRFPLLKITHLLDWQAIEAKLQNKKNRSVTDNNGRPAYALLPMFRAILLGQWHSLSDPELERSLVTRLDFVLFCQFPDETQLPDHSTLNRFRNWLMKDQLLDELIDEIN